MARASLTVLLISIILAGGSSKVTADSNEAVSKSQRTLYLRRTRSLHKRRTANASKSHTSSCFVLMSHNISPEFIQDNGASKSLVEFTFQAADHKEV